MITRFRTTDFAQSYLKSIDKVSRRGTQHLMLAKWSAQMLYNLQISLQPVTQEFLKM